MARKVSLQLQLYFQSPYIYTKTAIKKKACQHSCHPSQDSNWAPPKHKLKILPFPPTIPISLVRLISKFLRHIYVYWDVTVLHITAVTSLNQFQVTVWDDDSTLVP